MNHSNNRLLLIMRIFDYRKNTRVFSSNHCTPQRSNSVEPFGRLFFLNDSTFRLDYFLIGEYHSSHEQHLATVFLEKIHLLPCIRSFKTIISDLIFVRREGGAIIGRKLNGGGAGRKII